GVDHEQSENAGRADAQRPEATERAPDLPEEVRHAVRVALVVPADVPSTGGDRRNRRHDRQAAQRDDEAGQQRLPEEGELRGSVRTQLLVATHQPLRALVAMPPTM